MQKRLLTIGYLYLIALFVMGILSVATLSARLLATYVFATLLLIGAKVLQFKSYVQKLPDKKAEGMIAAIVVSVILTVPVYVYNYDFFRHLVY